MLEQKASKIVQTAADDSLTNSAKALEDARTSAGTEAKTVHSEGEAKVKEIMDNAASKEKKRCRLLSIHSCHRLRRRFKCFRRWKWRNYYSPAHVKI